MPSYSALKIVLCCLGSAFLAGQGAASDPPAGPMSAPAAALTPATQPATMSFQVVIDNFSFNPKSITVPAGAKITWVNHDDVPHTATSTSRPRAFDSRALDTDDQYSHVFNAPGTYPYFCAVHPHMTGQIIVK